MRQEKPSTWNVSLHRSLADTQHLASVAFTSSSRLLSSVESLHLPSTDTDFSPWKGKPLGMLQPHGYMLSYTWGFANQTGGVPGKRQSTCTSPTRSYEA